MASMYEASWGRGKYACHAGVAAEMSATRAKEWGGVILLHNGLTRLTLDYSSKGGDAFATLIQLGNGAATPHAAASTSIKAL